MALWGWRLSDQVIGSPLAGYQLSYSDTVLQLVPLDKKKGGPLSVDFDAAAQLYRREQAGIKQDIAKAVGCKPDYRPRILDATAGLATDASILAYLGCQVDLLEQSEVVYALLSDGLQRALQSENVATQEVVKNLLLLPRQSAQDFLVLKSHDYDVVYLDPMFPERQKSAKVKKAMQYLHDVAGIASLEQERQLLELALVNATKRVVVKRPRLAPFLADKKPSYQLTGKTIRYDVYLTA